jgi:heme/copper-type cytochrome/quinol oxidase subunit 1
MSDVYQYFKKKFNKRMSEESASSLAFIVTVIIVFVFVGGIIFAGFLILKAIGE